MYSENGDWKIQYIYLSIHMYNKGEANELVCTFMRIQGANQIVVSLNVIAM